MMITKRFSLVGLSASGKSTTMQLASKQTGIPVKETDSEMLRPAKVRENEQHPLYHVTQAFVDTFHDVYPGHVGVTSDEIWTLLPKTADFMKKFGTKAFRDLEEKLFVTGMRSGFFDGHLPDLGGAVYAREGARNALRQEGCGSRLS